MTKERFFDAFGGIDPAYVLAVDEILERSDRPIPFPRKKIIRTMLIAAVIAGLLTVTAYAAGLFGIQSRLIPSPAPVEQTQALPEEAEKVLSSLRHTYQREYISLSGVTGSNEYMAAAEWLVFKGTYDQQMAARQLENGETYYAWRDLERSFAQTEETKAICRLYQVWDETMWLKLQEIADKYDLTLHTGRSLVIGDELPSRDHGQYEDGSFLATAGTALEGKPQWVTLYLERHGALPADDLVASCADEYEEWEYKTAHGDLVSIAVRETTQSWLQPSYSILIFYNGEDVTITASAQWSYYAQDQVPDEKTVAEHLADSMDFSAIAGLDTPEDALALIRGGNT